MYGAKLDISACGGSFTASIPCTVQVDCGFYLPDYELLSSACWSVGVWNVPRTGTGGREANGNMLMFPSVPDPEGTPVMFDAGMSVTYASDTCDTYTSVYDGSAAGADLRAAGPLLRETVDNYEHACGLWRTRDSLVLGSVEYFASFHPDTCALIQRVTVCNPGEAPITIHVADIVDWDIPDDEGGVADSCGVFSETGDVWIGRPEPDDSYVASSAFCDSLYSEPVKITVANAEWVYPDSGLNPCRLGGFAANAPAGNPCPDTMPQDILSLKSVFRDLTLDPGECRVYSVVKTACLSNQGAGLDDLRDLIAKGKAWYHGIRTPSADPRSQEPSRAWLYSVVGLDSTAQQAASGASSTIENGVSGRQLIEIGSNLSKQGKVSDPRKPVAGQVSRSSHTLTVIELGTETERQLAYNDAHDLDPVPVSTWWQEVFPYDGNDWLLVGWWDCNRNEALDSADNVMLWNLAVYDCRPGDANGSDGSLPLDIDDVVYLINYIFASGPLPTPYEVCSGDANCSCGVDIDDVVYLIAYIFLGGPPPCACDEWVNGNGPSHAPGGCGSPRM
jgi:hypothetical protein